MVDLIPSFNFAPDKRQVYDRYGTETPEFRNHFHRSYGGHSFEEALFREFAGNGGFNPFFQFRQFNRRPQSAEPREPLTGWRALVQMLTQFLPIILLLSYTFVDTGGSRKYFSLSRTDYFTEQHETPLGTQFFVPRHMMYVNKKNESETSSGGKQVQCTEKRG